MSVVCTDFKIRARAGVNLCVSLVAGLLFLGPGSARAQDDRDVGARGGFVSVKPDYLRKAIPADDSPCYRDPDPSEVYAPPGYKVEVFARSLNFPVDITFSDDGELFIAEAGYHGLGDEPLRSEVPQIIQIRSDGTRRVVFEGTVPLDQIQMTGSSTDMPEGIIPPITGITWHKGKIYIAHRSRYSVFDPDDDNPKTRFKTIVNGLPQWGSSVNGKPVFDRDGKMVFFVSAQGNAGVVDELWATLILTFKKLNAHDVPGEDVTLTGRNFRVPLDRANNLGRLIHVPDEEVVLEAGRTTAKIPFEHIHNLQSPMNNDLTGAFAPLWTRTTEGQVVNGQKICNGAFFRCDPDGSHLERIAWGFSSCFGYRFAPDGRLICTQDGVTSTPPRGALFDLGSIYEVVPDEWYGWPDFFGGLPLTDHRFKGESGLGPLLTPETHRKLLKGKDRPRQPVARLPSHSSPKGMVFGRADFGVSPNAILVAEMGTLDPLFKGRQLIYTADDREERMEIADRMPATVPPGVDLDWPGFKVQWVDLKTGQTDNFLTNRATGPASVHRGRGLERPIQLEWGPDGALYLVDFGVISTRLLDGQTLLNPHIGTGAIWRVSRSEPSRGMGELPSSQSPSDLSEQFPRNRP